MDLGHAKGKFANYYIYIHSQYILTTSTREIYDITKLNGDYCVAWICVDVGQIYKLSLLIRYSQVSVRWRIWFNSTTPREQSSQGNNKNIIGSTNAHISTSDDNVCHIIRVSNVCS